MPHNLTPAIIRASLLHYLDGLQESGVDGIAGVPCTDAPRTSVKEPATAKDAAVGPAAVAAPAQHESLEKIRRDLGDCQRCSLGKTRKEIVFGAGNPNARLVFVGEGPGADEDAQGLPFVGEAGQILNRIITAMGLSRDEVYICNVVKCRPPKNREPLAEEIAACSPFLQRQLQSVRPEVIVALGKPAANTLLGVKSPISKLRGSFHDYHGVPLMPTYHPAYLLRNKGDSGLFWEVWDDMIQVLQMLKLPVPEKSRKK